MAIRPVQGVDQHRLGCVILAKFARASPSFLPERRGRLPERASRRAGRARPGRRRLAASRCAMEASLPTPVEDGELEVFMVRKPERYLQRLTVLLAGVASFSALVQ